MDAAIMKYATAALAVAATVLIPGTASGAEGSWEAALGFNFNKSDYTGGNFTWTRRWGASIGFHFSERSGVEVAFQDIVDRTKIDGFENTTFHDQIYSANWVQALVGRKVAIQPYFKIGIGQLNREAEGEYANGARPPALLDSVTGVLGAGLRLYLTRTFAVRMEATSYLAGGSVRTWKDNVSVSFGASLFF